MHRRYDCRSSKDILKQQNVQTLVVLLIKLLMLIISSKISFLTIMRQTTLVHTLIYLICCSVSYLIKYYYFTSTLPSRKGIFINSFRRPVNVELAAKCKIFILVSAVYT
jgi:hypothetical protein